MKYVSDNLKTHRAIKAPHHFTLALLLSPIHAAQLYYQKKYHLNYIHAKKLFLFDNLLILACIVFALSAYTWFTYDPTVSRFVDLRLTAITDNGTETIRSGEQVSYKATVVNNAPIALHDVTLLFETSNGFHVEQGELSHDVGILEPQESFEEIISGHLFESVEHDHHMSAVVRYRQENRVAFEEKIFTIIQNLRGSIISGTLSLPRSVVLGSYTPFTLTLSNDDARTAAHVVVPLTQNNVTFTPTKNTRGVVNNEWIIESLPPKTTTTLTGTVTLTGDTTTAVELTPSLVLPNSDRIAQRTIRTNVSVVKPSLSVSSEWNNTAPMDPAEERELTITVKNTGETTLQNINIEIPLANTSMSLIRLTSENGGTISNGTYTLKAPFTTLEPGDERSLTLRIDAPLRVDSGVNISLSPDPFVVATVAGTDNATVRTGVPVTPIPISTLVTLSAESRYYTEEGDQLGRGPLPPVVGEETKYWALIAISNSTNGLDNLHFSAALPDSAAFTGRTSVSHGEAPVFTISSRRIDWRLSRLEARDTAGIYMELSLIPTEGQRGTSPRLLENISLSATDAFTQVQIQRSVPPLDTSIPKDEIGQKLGTVVQ